MAKKTSIMLTEFRRASVSKGLQLFSVERVSVPVSRIAKASPHHKHPLEENDGAKSDVLLRSPEDMIMVKETPEEINALTNGDPIA